MRALLIPAVLFSLGCTNQGPVDPGTTDSDLGSTTDAAMMNDASDTCVVRRAPGASLSDPRGEVGVEVETTADCMRSYRISSTATRRNNSPASPRTVVERADAPALRSGNALFDGLYALTLEEVRENSVDAISDGSFGGGAPIDCAPGGCFETGAEWHYVWTRDISYALDLGLAALDPVRAQNSLLFKVSQRRDDTDAQIMQDTGTGGGYPVSTDRVVWALGASAVLDHLDGTDAEAFAATAFDALLNTVRHDRVVAYDTATGLYRGEQSFLDWREQSYPAWVAGMPVHIATSKSLSTNVGHLRAIELTAALAERQGRADVREELGQWADALRTAIVDRLWLDDVGLFSTFLVDEFDPTPSRQFDILGSALAARHVAERDQAKRIVSSYPLAGVGAPAIFPQQQFTRIYHNRAEWPFATAFMLREAASVRNDGVATRLMETLTRGTALNLSNMENWEIISGSAYVDDGEFSGPVVNSERQLWSVAAFVSLVHQVIFGVRHLWEQDHALSVEPALPRAFRAAYFAESTTLELRDYPYLGRRINIVLNLPEDDGEVGFYDASAPRLEDGGDLSDIADGATVVVDLSVPSAPEPGVVSVTDHTNWQALFAPRPPTVNLTEDAGELVVNMQTEDDPASLSWRVFRDGVQVADALAGTTSQWRTPLPNGASPCFVVESCFVDTQNCSQHSAPQCWWGSSVDRIVVIDALQMANVGGVSSEEYGRTHWSQWGDPDHRLSASGVRPTLTGEALIQLGYGNGAGPVDTGVTCGVKRITVTDEADDTVVGDGYVVMPHLGDWARWGLSSTVSATLDATRTYRIDVFADERAVNMSAFKHFASYGGEGGAAPFNRVNIAELRILSR